MTRFEKDRYVIEVEAGCDPVWNYFEFVRGIYCLIQSIPQDEVVPPKFYAVFNFLLDILPDWEDAKRKEGL